MDDWLSQEPLIEAFCRLCMADGCGCVVFSVHWAVLVRLICEFELLFGEGHNFISENRIILAIWKFQCVFSSYSAIKKCTPHWVCIFHMKLSAAAVVPHQD